MINRHGTARRVETDSYAHAHTMLLQLEAHIPITIAANTRACLWFFLAPKRCSPHTLGPYEGSPAHVQALCRKAVIVLSQEVVDRFRRQLLVRGKLLVHLRVGQDVWRTTTMTNCFGNAKQRPAKTQASALDPLLGPHGAGNTLNTMLCCLLSRGRKGVSSPAGMSRAATGMVPSANRAFCCRQCALCFTSATVPLP
jgi:hypothetical protein